MNTAVIVQLILQAIDAVMAEIAQIRGQSGQTDAQLDAALTQLLATNDALYKALKAALPTAPSATPATS